MINQVVLTGEYGLVFYWSGEYWLELKSDEVTFKIKVWKGIADVLADKPSGTLIGVKGKLFFDDEPGLKIQGEKVTIMSIA